jgi:uncharacterized protein YdaU (DUF1376 family)
MFHWLESQKIETYPLGFAQGLARRSPFILAGGTGRRAYLLEGDVSLPYFRKWVDNWLASRKVNRMSLAQRGLFDHMLCISWQEGPLEPDLNSLANQLQINVRTLRTLWQFPLKNCWIETEQGLINERLEEEREWANSKIRKAKQAAKHRWNGHADAHADAMQTHMQTVPHGSQCHLDLDPDLDPDPDIREEEEEEAPPMNIKWNGKEFAGPDFQLLVKTIKTRYEPEMGANWVRAVWLDIRDWCQDNPEKIAAKKKHDRFVLGWYRREAKQERHGENEATVQTQSEEAHFESQRGDDRELAIAACAKDGGHKLTHRRTHAFCPCGYVEFKEVT